MPARAQLLEKARSLPFQEISDSPTVKYYTNWRVFQRRLDMPDSTVYPDLPAWTAGIEARRVVLKERLYSDYPHARPLPEDYDVLKDIGVKGKMEYYHAARYGLGVEIVVPQGSNERILIASVGGDGYTGHHVHLEVENDAEATIYVVDTAFGKTIKTLMVTMRAGRRSKVRIYSVSLHHEAAVYTRRVYHALEDADVEVRLFTSSGDSSHIHEDYHIDGDRAKLHGYASSISLPGKWGDVILNAKHTGKESSGFIGARGVVYGGGLLAMRGLAMIMPEAFESDSHVEVFVATLEEGAKGYASPMLEIHTGAVRSAFHSASVASLSEDLLFYLRSRGLSAGEARTLLIEGIVTYSGVLDEVGLTIEEVVGR